MERTGTIAFRVSFWKFRAFYHLTDLKRDRHRQKFRV